MAVLIQREVRRRVAGVVQPQVPVFIHVEAVRAVGADRGAGQSLRACRALGARLTPVALGSGAPHWELAGLIAVFLIPQHPVAVRPGLGRMGQHLPQPLLQL